MRLTAPAELLLFLVGLAVLGYVGWTYRDQMPSCPARGPSCAGGWKRRAPTPPAASTAPAPQKGVLARIRQTGVLRVGMEPDAPPLHFINDRKQEDGFDFRLAGLDRRGARRQAHPGRRSRLRRPARTS